MNAFIINEPFRLLQNMKLAGEFYETQISPNLAILIHILFRIFGNG